MPFCLGGGKAMRAYWGLSLGICILPLCGCTATVMSGVSKSCSAHKDDCGGESGISYSLPKAQVEVSWSRTKAAQTSLQTAKAALAAAMAQKAKDQLAVETAQNKNPADSTIPGLTSQVAADDAAVSAANEAVTNANSNPYQETISLTVLPPAPDTTDGTHYLANLHHNILRDDSLSLTAPNGLLSTSSGTSIDQTPNIILSIADAVISFGALGVVPTGAANIITESSTPPAADTCAVDSWSVIFDPTSNDETAKAENELAKHTKNLSLSVAFKAPSAIPTPTGSSISGLVYRPLTSARITVGPSAKANAADNYCHLETGTASQSIVAIVPDSNVAYVIPQEASYFNTSTFNLGFNNGTLVSYSGGKPSEVLGVARIPGQIAKDLISIPTEILQLKYNYDSQATAVVNQEATLKAAEIQQAATISSALTAVKNAQTALLQADINQPTAVANAKSALVQAQTGLENAMEAAKAASVGPTTVKP